METIIDGSTLKALRAGIRGTAYGPGEDGYDEARRAWNLNADQHPAVVITAAGAANCDGRTRTSTRISSGASRVVVATSGW